MGIHMHLIAHHVGRLVEVTLASPITMDEVDLFIRDNLAVLQHIPGKFVGAANLLKAHVLPQDVADRMIQLLSGNAARVERSAMLIGDSAVFAMQVERVLHGGNHPNRRAFRSPTELAAWLGEVLTVPERAQLQMFLRKATGNGAS